MRWIGIDPGLRTTGFGIIDVDGQKLTYVASGTIESGDPAKGLPERLGTLYAGVKEVLQTYHPQSAAIEEVFLNVNPRSTLMLGQARGAVISALVSENLPVAEYSALRVKQAIVGTGRAAKPQVQEMVKRLLRLNRAPGSDASDALGLLFVLHTMLTFRKPLALLWLQKNVKSKKLFDRLRSPHDWSHSRHPRFSTPTAPLGRLPRYWL
jgi:crossover junction endodeoxyribonuclease RuvC